jgi:hypothetical protein
VPHDASTLQKKKPCWKRIHRAGDEVNIIKYDTLTTRDLSLGALCARPELDEENELLQAPAKKAFQVPSLEVCLGRENLQLLLEEEAHAAAVPAIPRSSAVNTVISKSLDAPLGSSKARAFVKVYDRRAVRESRESSQTGSGNQIKVAGQEKEVVRDGGADHVVQLGQNENQEATGPGAAGKLSGADVSTWQEQC